MGWREQKFEFVASSASTTLQLISLNPGWAGPVLDSLSLTPSGPSPAHTYQVVNGTFTWRQAKEDAERRGGYLATITSQAEYDHILSLGILPANDYWLGATDELVEGTWAWVTGEAWSFTKWRTGEPNNLGGEDYLIGALSIGHQWNDVGTPMTTVNSYLLETGPIPPPPPPPNGEFTNHTYQVISGTFTWRQAEQDAERRGGHLATITSQGEYDYILSLGILPANDYWLGATDELAEGSWTWVTGEAWSFTKWRSGEPNNLGEEDYLIGALSIGHQWNDVGRPTTTLNSYLLEIDGIIIIPPPPPPLGEFTNHTYQVIAGTFTWHQAKEDAERRGGHLATITSQGEYDYIFGLGILPANDYWLGATDEAVEGTWAWVTGEPWSFSYWRLGEPNNLGGEDYLIGALSIDHQWNDVGTPMTTVNSYLLEIDGITPPPPGLVVNGSFEIGSNPGISTNINAPNMTFISGWSVDSGSIDYIGSRWVAGDGVRCIDLSGEGAGSISQLVRGLTVGQRYKLSFLMAGNPELLPALGVIKRLRAAIGNVSQEFSFDASGKSPGNMGWQEKTLEFSATDTTLKLSFISLVANIGGPALDRIAIVPIDTPANRPPVAFSQSVTITNGSPTTIQLTGQDPDGDSLTFAVVRRPSHGTLTGVAPNLIYAPAAGFAGADSFTFKVDDGQLESPEATVTITVRGGQNPPVATAKLACVADIDGEGTWIAVSGNGTNASVVLDGSMSFDPDGATLDFLWFADGNIVPIAAAAIATNQFELGTHTVTLIVDDGRTQASETIAFEVLTIADALDGLCWQIEHSAINRERVRPLLANCSAAQASYQRGSFTSAVNQLGALRAKLAAQIEPNDADLARRWDLFVECIITAVPSR